MGLQPFYGKWSHRLFLAGSRTPRGQIAIGGSSNCLNYCVLFLLHAQFRNVAAGRKIQIGGPRFGDQCSV